MASERWHTDGMFDPGSLDEAVDLMCDGDGDAFRVVYRSVQAPLLRLIDDTHPSRSDDSRKFIVPDVRDAGSGGGYVSQRQRSGAWLIDIFLQ